MRNVMQAGMYCVVLSSSGMCNVVCDNKDVSW